MDGARRPGITLRMDGGDDVRTFPASEVTLGSAPHCDVRLDAAADAVHCIVARTRHGYVVEDLRSSTGTFVAGRRVTQSFVEPGQTVRAGGVTFEIVERG